MVTVGTNAAIVQDVTVGEGTTIGAGATVLEDLPANVTAVGTPARPI
jgi:serine acetyltransferase